MVFHAAALKHVIFCENNISEAIKTNLLGTQNVITASINNNVEKIIYISTDKAVNPTSVMGSTKLIGERLSIDSNKLSKTKISCVRFGNVLSSRGSVFQTFKKQIENGKKLTITDTEMTRFVMTPSDAISLVLEAGNRAEGGEIFILKMPSMRIIDLAKAMCKYYGKENEIEINDESSWWNISAYDELSEEFIEKYADRVDWDCISKYQKLSEQFIERHKDKVNWYYISMYQELSEKFIEKHEDKVNWYYISMRQKLSESFIEKHEDKVYWSCLSKYQKISKNLIKKYKDRINIESQFF